jgi:hypothetical protein
MAGRRCPNGVPFVALTADELLRFCRRYRRAWPLELPHAGAAKTVLEGWQGLANRCDIHPEPLTEAGESSGCPHRSADL